MIRSLRVLFIVAVSIACAVDQPLPPANNPSTITSLCGSRAPCADGQVCNLAVGGGTCLDPCVVDGAPDDAYCSGIIEGFVCHASLSACAPKCTETVGGLSGDRVCGALGANLACQTSGQCLYVAPSETAFVRVFNATATESAELQMSDFGTLVTATAPGQLSPEVTLPGAAREFTWVNGSTTLASGSVTLAAGRHYYAVLYRVDTGFAAVFVDDVSPSLPLAGNGWLRYRSLLQGLADQNVFANGQLAASGFGFKQEGDPAQVPGGAVTLAVGPVNKPSTMVDAVPFEADRTYLAVTWEGLTGVIPETTVLGRVGVVGRLRPAGFRVFNATDDGAVTVTIDGETTLTAAGALTTAPGAGYFLVSKGAHNVQLTVGATTVLDEPLRSFLAGERQTVGAFGASGSYQSKAFTDEPTMQPAAGKLLARVAHFVSTNQATVDVDQQIPSATLTPITTLLNFGDLSTFAELPVGDTFSLEARFASGLPLIAGSNQVTTGQGRVFTALLTGPTGPSSTLGVLVLDERGQRQNVTK